ncbi:unnamed protein product [Protopolystoma xenopodis]|uniref:Uncharacterized protein n=1 Tax=Protopolystoma xenopodis TaxID=117903 RepID=A0A448WCW6_9PLAT|nr:unnamed protein product [Protopolystoma xenopodis]
MQSEFLTIDLTESDDDSPCPSNRHLSRSVIELSDDELLPYSHSETFAGVRRPGSGLATRSGSGGHATIHSESGDSDYYSVSNQRSNNKRSMRFSQSSGHQQPQTLHNQANTAQSQEYPFCPVVIQGGQSQPPSTHSHQHPASRTSGNLSSSSSGTIAPYGTRSSTRRTREAFDPSIACFNSCQSCQSSNEPRSASDASIPATAYTSAPYIAHLGADTDSVSGEYLNEQVSYSNYVELSHLGDCMQDIRR